jgi:hypothetical protein
MSRHWARKNAKLGRAERRRGELTSVCRAGDGERGARLIHGTASEFGLFTIRASGEGSNVPTTRGALAKLTPPPPESYAVQRASILSTFC